MKQDICVSFPVISFRRIPLTQNPDQTNLKRFIAICDTRVLPSDLPRETNPRQVKLTTRVAKEIEKSFHDEDYFHVLNRGIFLSAKHVSHDDKSGAMTINLGSEDEKDKYGIVDGGHTYAIILKELNKLEETKVRYVCIELFVGIGEEISIADFADARNNSVQIDQKSLAELEKKFQFIKDILAKESYDVPIAYVQNQEGVDVRELIALLTAFDTTSYPKDDTSKQPVITYSAKEACLNAFIADEKRYHRLAHLLPKILRLSDYIRYKYGAFWNRGDEEKRGRIGSKAKKANVVYRFRPDLNGENYDLERERWMWLPVLGALRMLLEEKEDSSVDFKIDPFTFFENYGPELVQIIRQTRDGDNKSPNAIGKSKTVWEMLAQKVIIRAYINPTQAKTAA